MRHQNGHTDRQTSLCCGHTQHTGAQLHAAFKSQVGFAVHYALYVIVPNLNHSQGIFVVGATDEPKSPGHIIEAAHLDVDNHVN